jgi:hypothetical protein
MNKNLKALWEAAVLAFEALPNPWVEGIFVLSDTNNRQHKRASIKWPVKIRSGNKTLNGETRNVSESGILICIKEPLRLNQDYIMSLCSPNADNLELHGTVVWSDLYGIDESDAVYGVGICFVKISKTELHSLNNMIPNPV